MVSGKLLVVLGATLATSVDGASADEFYKGKTITYVVATSPGGTFDTLARLIGRHVEKQFGATVLMRNVPGTGHIIGANTVYSAKPDGLTIGTFNRGLIYTQLLSQAGVKFDLEKMSWIGKAVSDTRSLVLGTNSGFKNFEEFAASSLPPKLASAGVGSSSYIDIKILMQALRIKAEIVHGFQGTEGEMSMRRGEVAGTLGATASLKPFVKNGYGFYALEVGGTPGSSVPQARDFAKDERSRAMMALIEAQSSLGRLTAGPPGIREDRLKGLLQFT